MAALPELPALPGESGFVAPASPMNELAEDFIGAALDAVERARAYLAAAAGVMGGGAATERTEQMEFDSDGQFDDMVSHFTLENVENTRTAKRTGL